MNSVKGKRREKLHLKVRGVIYKIGPVDTETEITEIRRKIIPFLYSIGAIGGDITECLLFIKNSRDDSEIEIYRWKSSGLTIQEFDSKVTATLLERIYKSKTLENLSPETKMRLFKKLENVFKEEQLVFNAPELLRFLLKAKDHSKESEEDEVKSRLVKIPVQSPISKGSNFGETMDFLKSGKDESSHAAMELLPKLTRHLEDKGSLLDMFHRYNCIPIGYLTELSKMIDPENVITIHKDELHSMFRKKDLTEFVSHITQEQESQIASVFLKKGGEYKLKESHPTVVQFTKFNVLTLPHFDVTSEEDQDQDNILLIFERIPSELLLKQGSQLIPMTHREYMAIQLQMKASKVKVGVCGYWDVEHASHFYAVEFNSEYTTVMNAFLWSLDKMRKLLGENRDKSISEREMTDLQSAYLNLKSMFKTQSKIKNI